MKNEYSYSEEYESNSLCYYKMYPDVNSPLWGTVGSACFDLYSHFEPGGIVVGFNSTNTEIHLKFRNDNVTTQDHNNNYILVPIGSRVSIPTGLVLDIPSNHSVRIHPRSGYSLKTGMTMANCEGIVDSDYVEQIYIVMHNSSNKTMRINHGERIAQGEMVESINYKLNEIENKPKTKTDRVGGFGSTGML